MSDNKLPNNRKGWLTPQQKLVLIHSVDKGRFSVSEACRQADISRKTFYKWRNRYCVAKAEAAKVFEALSPKKKTYLQRHPCRSADLFATEVLEVVKRNPSLSSREIAKHVCLSMTGVWGVLKRAGLATQKERKRFRRLQLVLKPWLALVFVIEYLLGGVIIPEIPLIYPLLLTIPKERRPTILYIPLLLLILGAGWRLNQTLFIAQPSFAGRVGLVFAEIALIFGMFFFIYSVKYYLTLALVLVSSRRTNGSTNGFSNGLKNGLKNGLNGLNGKNGRLNARLPDGQGFFNGNGRLNGFLNGLKKGLNNGHLNGLNGHLNGQLGGFDRLGRWLGLNGLRNGLKNGNGGLNGFLNGHLNGRLNGRPNGLTGLNGNGLNGPDLQKIKLKEKPFVSIHLPFYNEKRVAGRILKACSKLNYPNFEVLVVDDSNDGTTEIVKRWAKKDKRIKLLHRPNREGWKGGALRYALTKIDPRAEFVVVFDADFIPFPDTLEWFLRYFHFLCGGLRNVAKSRIAAVQGYQWHVLNKDENWITRGVRGEYAGSYIIERSGTELLGSLKQIAGSVYMIRTDLLKEFGWGTSITEDFQLTLRLYEQGYKVIYTPYIQAPAECVSTIKRLIRQRMRWAEGHTHNVRKMFTRLWYSPKMNLTEKLEFLYLSPYYLQSLLFLVGTLSWLLADIVFQTGLPFWTATWGWSLVFTNMFSLILMNAVGLFIEESDTRDYKGLLSFIATTYLVVPFQAYAAVKGFFEREEGDWFRTPKTGLITIEVMRGHFARLVGWLLPRRAGERARRRLASNSGIHSALNRRELKFANPYLALATANNQFSNFAIRPRHIRWLGNLVFTLFILLTISLIALSPLIPFTQSTQAQGPGKLVTVDDVMARKVNREEEKIEEINTPRQIRFTNPNGKDIEVIFHKEPRVRLKVGEKEIEITTLEINGLGKVLPKRSLLVGENEVRYEEIVEGVDLVYLATSRGFEEKFIVKKPLDFEGVVQRVNVKEVKVIGPNSEVFGFYDENNKEVFAFDDPWMREEGADKKEREIKMALEKEIIGWKLQKNLTPLGKEWFSDPARRYPIVIDPTTIVSSGVTDGTASYGANQRKIVYSTSSSAWYVVYESPGATVDLGDTVYYKSSDGASWAGPTDIDSTDCTGQESGPTTWLEGSLIYVVWNTRNCGGTTGTDDSLVYRTINTASADALGTRCSTIDLGAIAGTDQNSIAVVGTNVFMVNDNDPDFMRGTTTCGTAAAVATGHAVTATDRPVLIEFNGTLHVFFQDGQLSWSRCADGVCDAAGDWTPANQTIDATTSTVFSVTTNDTNIWILAISSSTAAVLYTCAGSCDALADWGSPTPLTTPFTGLTNLTAVSITYDTTNADLYAHAIYQTDEIAYFTKADNPTAPSWDGPWDYGWSGTGDYLGHISSPMTVTASAQVGVVLRDTATYKFATVPEKSLILLLLAPFLPGALKKIRERRRKLWRLA